MGVIGVVFTNDENIIVELNEALQAAICLFERRGQTVVVCGLVEKTPHSANWHWAASLKYVDNELNKSLLAQIGLCELSGLGEICTHVN